MYRRMLLLVLLGVLTSACVPYDGGSYYRTDVYSVDRSYYGPGTYSSGYYYGRPAPRYYVAPPPRYYAPPPPPRYRPPPPPGWGGGPGPGPGPRPGWGGGPGPGRGDHRPPPDNHGGRGNDHGGHDHGRGDGRGDGPGRR